MLTSMGTSRLLAAAAMAVTASCQMTTDDFGGLGGSFGGCGESFEGSGGSLEGTGSGTTAGQALASDIWVRSAQQRGQIVAGDDRIQPVFAGYENEIGADVYLRLRRDPMTVSTTVARCRFTYASGQAFVLGI
jgi:hypothetical protein